jgi:hypothetical protein
MGDPDKCLLVAHSELEVTGRKNTELKKKAGANIFMEFDKIPTWETPDSINWYAPSSFVIFTDGHWSLSAARLYNGYNRYTPIQRHFSINFYFLVKYLDRNGGIVYQNNYLIGGEGYLAGTDNVNTPGNDPGILGVLASISGATGQQNYESYY